MDDKKRRVLIRLIGAPLIIAALFGILYLDYQRGKWYGLVVVVGTMACISLHEICAMMRLKGMKPVEAPAILALALLFAGFLPIVREQGWDEFLPWIVAGMAIMAGAASAKSGWPLLLAFAYAGMAGFVLLDVSVWMLAFLFATSKGSDMAAYSVGKLIGRHKMAPTISPNKTWEGATAGLLVGSAAGVWVLVQAHGDMPMRPHSGPDTPTRLVLCGMAVVVTIAAQVGDLVKSAIKRWAGVKDSGRLLPEFGGALDMVDSFLISAPVAWVLFRVLG